MIISPKYRNLHNCSITRDNQNTFWSLFNSTAYNSVSGCSFSKLSCSVIYNPVSAINSFTRSKIREESFYRRIMPPIPI